MCAGDEGEQAGKQVERPVGGKRQGDWHDKDDHDHHDNGDHDNWMIITIMVSIFANCTSH